LRESIAHGSTMNVQDLEAVESSYYGGPYEDHWRVYDREGQPCPRCGKLIRRITQGGRSSYFCGRCQRR
jgi:formamidopyrimidine-DNA glycosylase